MKNVKGAQKETLQETIKRAEEEIEQIIYHLRSSTIDKEMGSFIVGRVMGCYFLSQPSVFTPTVIKDFEKFVSKKMRESFLGIKFNKK